MNAFSRAVSATEQQRVAGAGGVPQLEVTVVLLDDGMSSTAIMPVEIFHSAGGLWHDLHARPGAPAFRVTTVSVSGGEVRSPYGLMLRPQAGLDDIEHTDIIIVATSGLQWNAKLVENSALVPWLRQHYGNGAYVAGVCMGAAYLAQAGLLDGRMATTHWAIAEQFAAHWPQVLWRPDLLVTEDSRVLCSGGVYAAIDVSLYLVEKLCGHEVAVQTAKSLLLPIPRSHQSGYAVLPLSPPHSDERIRAAEMFLQASFKDDISTETLARRAGLSHRTFARRFKAATGKLPAAYLQAVRIETAKSMLERDNMAIQTVSSA
ncbi:MAG TPA: DJ-1/PfpI family protein, partial [Phenylobacterium sp.]